MNSTSASSTENEDTSSQVREQCQESMPTVITLLSIPSNNKPTSYFLTCKMEKISWTCYKNQSICQEIESGHCE